MIDIFQGLNEKQKEAVLATEGKIKVVAGAGSGKTRVLAHRFAHLVNNLCIDPGNILCMTFTNKAAQEMRSRIAKLVSAGNTNDFVCTIHGFCVKVLRRDIHRLGFPKTFTILDEDDAESLAKQVLELHGLDRTKKTIKELHKDVHKFKHFPPGIDYIDNYMLPESPKYKDTSGFTVIESYIHYQALNYALQFDDIIAFAVYLLTKFDEVRNYWQETLNYVMIDETQDCNGGDWTIASIITELYDNLFVVGDPDQAIYEWRGARPDDFINWVCDKEIILAENYRSTPDILNVANCVISNNKKRIPKDLHTSKPSIAQVVHFHADNEGKEAEWIAKQIEKLCKVNSEWSKCAILYRASYLSRSIEQELLRKKIPYTIWGGIRFFERKEIKDSICYLRLIAGEDDLAAMRIINVPSRRFGDKSIKKLQQLAKEQKLSLFEALRTNLKEWETTKSYVPLKQFIALIDECRQLKDNSSVSELLNYVLKESGLNELYRTDTEVERLENVEELISSIRFYEEVNEDNDISLYTYLQDIALYTNADYKKEAKTVKLMTVHQAKGLEFPYVFVNGLSEGIFPSHRSLRERKIAALEEERRLMYVAITRAEQRLFLTESEGYNFQTKTDKFPSRFLTEIKRNFLIQEGEMDETLWEGTKSLSKAIDDEISGKPSENEFSVGTLIKHEYLGIGRIMELSSDGLRAKIRFGENEKSDRFIMLKALKQPVFSVIGKTIVEDIHNS